MTMKKMFALDTVSGIQRDGTIFDKNFYNDGQWVRFQRGRPRKILGYKEITASLAGPSRGIYVNPQNGFTQIFSGYNNGMQVLPINNVGIGVGISDFLMYGFTPNDNNLWQFDTFADVSGSGNNLLLAHAGQNLTEIDSTTNTPPLAGPINGFFTLSGTTTSGSATVTLSAPNSFVVVGLAVTGTGIPANTFVASVSGTTVTLTKNATASGTVTLTYTNFTMSKIGQFTQNVNTTNGSASAVIDYPFTNQFIIGAGQSVSGSGIQAGTTVVSIVGNTITLSLTATASTGTTLASVAVTGTAGQCSCTATTIKVGQSVYVTGTNTGSSSGITAGTYYVIATNGTTTFTLSNSYNGSAITTTAGTTTGLTFVLNASATLTFDNNLSVSGGIVTLHPYVFIFGNDGLIQNSGAGNINDWVSATSNSTNVATGKIVQGLPVRGGSNAPSGLFWSLDSVIRVSYTPTTVTVGATAVSFYWRYDIITSQSSILSAQCVIEYDGIYYWIGVDRFLLYNGVVKEIPNDMNQNYFFDNLNYAQRQKVYATKVTRYGEVWWFYPRGDSEECNDAIIYNIREKTWYDAGTAVGTQRSAGYFSQVFHYPINADWNVNLSGGVNGFSITNGGSSYTNGTYVAVNLTGGSGTGAQAIVIITGGAVTTVYITTHGYGYQVGDVLSASTGAGAGYIGTTGSGFQMTITTTIEYVSLYQHEIGTDAVKGGNATAIQSYFETNDLGWVSGGPSQPSPVGQNNWLRIERLEPDFLLTGTMDLYITGRPFAQSTDYTSGPYTFDVNTNKIDLKEQRRELRLKFVSNVAGGNYQLGKILIGADIGDVRGY
jgi:hypothetical protein